MNNAKWLAPLALVLVVVAIVLRPQGEGASQQGELLIPGLESQLEAVSKVELVTAGDTVAITLSKTDGAWGIEQRDGYPIQFDRLRSILRALAQLKTAEAMTSNPEYFSRLGVTDVADVNSDAKAIRIYNAAGEKLAGVLLGDTAFRAGNEHSYLRLEGQNQSWLVQGGIDLWLTAPQWLNKDLLNTPRAQITQVEINHPNGETLVVSREQDENGEYAKDLTVQNVPEGKTLLYPSVGNGPAEALQNLRLEDVQTADSFTWQPDNIVTTNFSRKDGLVISTQAERRETEYFMAISVDYSGDSAELKVEAQKLNARFDGWVYHLQPYKYQALAKRMDQMLKDE